MSDTSNRRFSALLKQTMSSTCYGLFRELLYIPVKRKRTEGLLESRIEGYSPYNVRLAESEGSVHAFYIISHNRKQLLTYQKIDGPESMMPEVLGVIIRDGQSYTVSTDDVNIHLFFLTDVQGINLLVHRKLYGGKASKPITTPFPYSASLRLQSVISDDGLLYILASPDDGQMLVSYKI